MTKDCSNAREVYLIQTLSKLTHVVSNTSYWYAYNLKRVKRFLATTGIAFFVQYLMLIHLSVTYPAAPLYPPMGSAFVMFYLLGNTPLLGLCLGGFCAYFLNGLTLPSLLLYLTADLGCSYLGVLLCRSVLSSDISIYVNSKEWLRFVVINACTSCFLSSLLRVIAVIVYDKQTMSFVTLGYCWLNFWLADVNAIVVFSGFFLSWIVMYVRREPVAHTHTSHYKTMGVLLLLIIGAVWMKKLEFIWIVIAIAAYAAHCYGVLIASAASYVLSFGGLVYFMANQQHYLNDLGLPKYTLIPCVVLLCLLVMQCLGQASSKKYYSRFGG